MGRVKKGNPNAQRNNNAKKMEEFSDIMKKGSYAEREEAKMENNQLKR
jgi:hypothetical protein